MAIPDPYARSTFHGKPLDNATIARLKQAEARLGYELTITQGIGGAAASAGTHTEGRAVDLAAFEHARKVKVLRDLGFAAWYRPAIAGLWPAHVHAVMIFEGRSNQRGIAASAWRQIGSYDRGRNGLAYDAPDPDPYRPEPRRGFSLDDYRATFAPPPQPAPEHVTIVVATANLPDKTDRPRWLPRNQRALALVALLRKLDVEVAALQELATISRMILTTLGRWRLRSARFNNVFTNTSLGNSILRRQRRSRVLDFHNLHAPMEGRKRGLNMPVLLLEDRDSGAVYAVMGVHNPSNRPNRRIGVETRDAAKDIEVAYAKRILRRGIPVLVLGDFNERDVSEFTAAGFVVAHREGVDAVLAADAKVLNGGTNESLEGKASDHPLVWAKVRLPVQRNPVARTLPKENA